MKLFNLPRAGGKSIRMIYASEFNNAPILCVNEVSKAHLLYLSRVHKVDIPEPITVNQLITGRYKSKEYCNKILVDEAISVLQAIIKANGIEMIGCTMSDEKNERIAEQLNERGDSNV